MAFINNKHSVPSLYNRCQNQGCSSHGQILVNETELLCRPHFEQNYDEQIKAVLKIQLEVLIKISQIFKKKN